MQALPRPADRDDTPASSSPFVPGTGASASIEAERAVPPPTLDETPSAVDPTDTPAPASTVSPSSEESGPASDGDAAPFDITALQMPERRPSELTRAQLGSSLAALAREDESRLWELATKASTKEALMAYLRAFPKGLYAHIARRRLAALKSAPPRHQQLETALPPMERKERKRSAITATEAKGKVRQSPKREASDVGAAKQQSAGGAAQTQSPVREQSARMRWPSSDEPFVDPLPGTR